MSRTSISKTLKSVTLQFQGGFVGVACQQMRKVVRPIGSTRGDVTVFSKRSRHRILKMFSKLSWKGRKAIFVTLTYPEAYPDPHTAKRHLRAFLKRVYRLVGKRANVWRLEFQERGAPHFHILFVDLPWIDKEKIQEMWGEIIGCERPFTRIEFCRNKKKTMYYVSKYIAKNDYKKVKGTRVYCGFIYVPYQAVAPFDPTPEDSIGRFWGTEMSDLLPYAPCHTFTILDCFASLYTLKRYARKVWARTNTQKYRGFCIFVDNADRWLELMRDILVQEYRQDAELVRGSATNWLQMDIDTVQA